MRGWESQRQGGAGVLEGSHAPFQRMLSPPLLICVPFLSLPDLKLAENIFPPCEVKCPRAAAVRFSGQWRRSDAIGCLPVFMNNALEADISGGFFQG